MIQQKSRVTLATGILLAAIYSIGLFEMGRELGQVESEELFHRQLRVHSRSALDCGGHPKKIYGHIHMAKTGGTSLNGIFANKFERVCGHKGYSYDAYHDNELAAVSESKGLEIHPDGRSRVFKSEMNDIGFDDCDYVSNEVQASWWIKKFADARFHNIQMELHVPCRDPIDHLMSQCNHMGKTELSCDAKTDNEFFQSIEACFVAVKERYTARLENHFDIKCFDFKQSFTTYVEYMKGFLEERRMEPDRYVQRETNSPRDKESECIWQKPDLMEKATNYLLEHVPYYKFCNECMGTENELMLDIGTAVTV